MQLLFQYSVIHFSSNMLFNATSENKYTKMYLKYMYCHLLYTKYVTHTFTYCMYVHIMNTLHL